MSIQETFVGNTLMCNKLNEFLWIYDMEDCLKIPILRDHIAIHDNFIWGGDYFNSYLLDHMNAFTFNHVLLWEKVTNTYTEHNTESSKCINALCIASSTNELNIQVNDKFYLLTIIEQGDIVCLNLMLDNMFFVSEAVVPYLHTWLFLNPKSYPQRQLERT